jgi:hypothetical protein
MELLHLFDAVERLYLSKEFASRTMPALLESVGEDGVTKLLLPALRELFIENLPLSRPVQETIGQFVAARELSAADHPITVSEWDRKYKYGRTVPAGAVDASSRAAQPESAFFVR